MKTMTIGMRTKIHQKPTMTVESIKILETLRQPSAHATKNKQRYSVKNVCENARPMKIARARKRSACAMVHAACLALSQVIMGRVTSKELASI